MDEDVKNLVFAFGGIVVIILIYLLISNWGYFSSDSFGQATKDFFNIKTYK
jgi:hypothetical protein